jgi:hypothetical protein
MTSPLYSKAHQRDGHPGTPEAKDGPETVED